MSNPPQPPSRRSQSTPQPYRPDRTPQQRRTPPRGGPRPAPSRESGKPSGQMAWTIFGVASNLGLAALLLGATAVAGTLIGLATSFRGLPDVASLDNYIPSESTLIVDTNGDFISVLHGEANRKVVSLDSISPEMKLSLLAVEDSHFYIHGGINPVGIGRALVGSFSGGFGSAGGGSTLTMQLVKNLFLTPERSVARKAAEAVLAVRVERIFEKDEILEMYLNQVYWGHNLYGIQTAAESYFGKSASELDLAESAMLAGLLQAPEQLSPFRNFDAAKQRQELVLQRMVELEWVEPEVAEAAAQQELTLGRVTSFQSDSPGIADAIEAELTELYGREALLRGGYRVQAAIDLDLQRKALEAVANGFESLEASGRQADQVALVAVEPQTGLVKALVGGANAQRGQFNRVTQALRQPGSAFKPFVYYAALASGDYGLQSILDDSRICYPDVEEEYCPRNYDNTFRGRLPLQRSLELSRNVPTVKLAYDVGIGDVIEAAEAAGIQQTVLPNLSISLGAADVTPLEMASSYATFANTGYRIEPRLILQVIDNQGNVLDAAEPEPELTMDPWSVATLVQGLRGVTEQGTGQAARLADGRPIAGKTGTTSDFRDAWFVGFTPQLSTAVWIGNDDNSPMADGTSGGVYVAPIWKDFMTAAMEGEPVEQFPNPSTFVSPRQIQYGQ